VQHKQLGKEPRIQETARKVRNQTSGTRRAGLPGRAEYDLTIPAGYCSFSHWNFFVFSVIALSFTLT
jgi:hypothetical protein